MATNTGTLNQRPPCGYKGHTFLATDSGQTFLDTGSDWVLQPKPAPAPPVAAKAPTETAVKATASVEHAVKS
jgi:hypothetical protein